MARTETSHGILRSGSTVTARIECHLVNAGVRNSEIRLCCGSLPRMPSYWQRTDDPTVAVVVRLYVAAEFRCSGLGRQLLETVLDRLAERPEIGTIRLSINPNQAAACALYQSAGFKRARHPDSNDTEAEAWWMERPARRL